MSRRRLIAIAATVLVIAFLAYFLAVSFEPRPGAAPPQVGDPADTNVQEPERKKAAERLQRLMSDKDVLETHERMLQENMDIEFIGMLLNQRREPIPGVVVKFEVSRYKSSYLSEFAAEGMAAESTFVKDGEVVTDENGVFRISGYTGRSLQIILPSGERYEDPAGNQRTRFPYWEFSKNDASNPYPFYLIDRQVPMVAARGVQDVSLALGRDESNVKNMSVQKLLASPELRVRGGITVSFTTAASPDTPRKGFAWRLERTGDGVGFRQSEADVFVVQAPEDGYEETIVFEEQEAANDWTRTHSRSYFFSADGGSLYGVFDVRVSAGQWGGAFVTFKNIRFSTDGRNLVAVPD